MPNKNSHDLKTLVELLAAELAKKSASQERDRKRMVNLYLDKELWATFHGKYGRNASKIISEFIEAYLKADEDKSA
jgi:hypothetical protein